ncbi:MAG TPA: carboxyl transferase domain-containing protein [Anaeromyxobacter sp.]|nr:carboxyl transferase domain-containing protein [Anaeromyxobacter sp.]
MPETTVGLGRVLVLDRGESGRRALRAVRELVREGRAEAAVAGHPARERRCPLVREADEAVEVDGRPELALGLARAGAAWLGPAPVAVRAAFAEACGQLGVVHLGPSAATLRRVATPDAVAALAAELGVPAAGVATPDDTARLLEVIAVRDAAGNAAVVGVGDASLRLADVAVLAESPAPGLRPDEDPAARALALRAVAAAGWTGVAAVQLLLDPRTRRLSLVGIDALARAASAVEAAAGVDLVRLALRIGAGLPLGPVPLTPRGHALAARLLARDPDAGLAASPGVVEVLRFPSDPEVRAEAAVEEGDAPPAGEPLATLVARGADRPEALARLAQALADADVLVRGTGNTRAWLLALLDRPEVRAGGAGVGFLPRLAAAGTRLTAPRTEIALLAAAVDAYDAELDLERARFLAEARRGRPRVGPSAGRTVELRHDGVRHRLEVRQTGPGGFRITPAGGAAVDVGLERAGPFERRLEVAGRRHRVLSTAEGALRLVEVAGVAQVIEIEPEGVVASPMPAVVVAIPVVPGQRVAKGEPVARIESMKMELAVAAPEAGVVREVVAVPNTQVDAGAPLVRLAPRGGGAEPGGPLELGGAPTPAPADPRGRYLAALDELIRLTLGYDVAPAEAKRLAAGWRAASEGAPADDPDVLRAESRALAAFGELQVLFGKARPPEPAGARPPIEELWLYLHEPGVLGPGLSPGFLAGLRRALAHHGVSVAVPGRALEIALLRIQKAHERAEEALGPILSILERRLRREGLPPTVSPGDARATIDRLVEVGEERFPALADLARELRYRRFDEPALERVRAEIYAEAEAALARLAGGQGEAREAAVAWLVACPQPIVTLLLSRLAAAQEAVRPRLVETILRRYYRIRPLRETGTRMVDGVPLASTRYLLEGKTIRILAAFAPADRLDRALRVLAAQAAETPADGDLAVEVYAWRDGPGEPEEAQVEALAAALARARFPRPLRRASLLFAMPGRGLERRASQQHFTFRGGPEAFEEDRRYRGVHPLLFRRMQLGRLARFDLERLPSADEIHLYRGVARGSPRDERLFAVAEVRDLTPIRDAAGRVVQLPSLERLLHEALAGMRRFQAQRAPHQRLEWNRIMLTVEPPMLLSREEVRALAERLAPATRGVGLEMVAIAARAPDPAGGPPRDVLLRVTTAGGELSLRYDEPTDRPLEPMAELQQRVTQLRRRGLTHPYEIVKMLAPARGAVSASPPGEFVEHDLDAAGALVPVQRPPGQNEANMVVGVVRSFTDRYPEGMQRVVLLGDPSRAMGSLAEPECRRIEAALDLAARLRVPLEWFAVSAGAKISMESGTENMDWISRVLRRIVDFTQAGGEINVVVTGINVGAQPYWNAEATMLMHTRGILVMTPGSALVLTGKEALEFSGSVSAEDNQGIGGYDRIMGPNGQAQYRAGSLAEALQILLQHYAHTYVAPGERFPRRAATVDPPDRDVRASPHGPEGGAGFETVGDVFSPEKNPERKKPFAIRRVMEAVIDQDHPPLERWRDLRGGETAVVWDAHLGGWPVCLIGIESHPVPRLEVAPADGPDAWSAGTLFPQSSKKIARAVNGASGVRPVVVLANLSGFDGSPESMRKLQLEYGAEIGRAVVNFRGPFVFCVVSRYHGGAFVVFSKALREDLEVVAVEGARASVIGGAPAAAVVFAREVETRARKDPRLAEPRAEKALGPELGARIRSEKVGEVAEEFDRIHTVERALKVGSLDRIIAPADLRPYLVGAVERGIARTGGR